MIKRILVLFTAVTCLCSVYLCGAQGMKTKGTKKGNKGGKGKKEDGEAERNHTAADDRNLSHPFGPNRDKINNHFCQICRNNRIPRKNNIMNFLYIGTGTCMDYWINGQMSRLPTHMCSVIQYYAYETCGCHIDKPNSLLMSLAEKLRDKNNLQTKGMDNEDEHEMDFPRGHLLDLVVVYDQPGNETIQNEICLN